MSSLPYPVNTLQQDLALLCKNHYPNEHLSRVDAARVVIAFHVLHDVSRFSVEAAAHWMVKEFIVDGIVLTKRSELARFLMEFGRYAKEDASYHVTLVEEIWSRVALTRAYDGERYLLPFEWVAPDPNIVTALETYRGAS
ncbi:hypothetical protein LUCX_182 [Xanthomonas phage vB_XciM_LucasX]|nr:hypothetical protein LUCX_182 [Xanthomonas phage vB_XciM_LucasX]